MPSNLADQAPTLLATAVAAPGDRRLAFAVVAASVVVFLALAPFAKTPLAQVPAFIPIYESALVTNDLITAVLLFIQFRLVRSKALFVLAGGYLFTALIAVPHALTFPGLFAPTGLLGAGPQSTAWLYMFWHGGFPLFIIAYALLKGEGQDAIQSKLTSVPIIPGIVAVSVIVCGFTLLATVGQDSLPAVMRGNQYTPAMTSVVTSTWVLSLIALLVLWRKRPHSILDLWLMVVLLAWLFDIALAAVLNAGRYDIGFYAGRIYGLLASLFVLLVLLLENGALYARLIAVNKSKRAAELALQSEEARYRQFVELSPFGVFVQCDGQLAFLNPKAVSMLGAQTQAELLARPVLDFLHPDSRDAARERIRKLNVERVATSAPEAQWLRLDGSVFYAEATAVPYTFEGRPGALVLLQDVTQRHEADVSIRHLNDDLEHRIAERSAALDALHNREEEISAVLNNLLDCVITIDAHGIVRGANPAVERVLGYAADEVIGRNVSMLMPEPHRGGHDAYLARYLRTGEARIIGIGREVEGLHKDGRRIPLDLAITEYGMHGERLFIGTLRDIRERKRFIEELTEARSEAEQANRAKSAFLATMSHEIRTPMNGVIGMVEVLSHGNLSEHQSDLVKTIRESASTLLTLIDDILDFSKIEAGRLEIERAPVSVADLVEGLCNSLVPVAARRGVDLSLFISPEIPERVLSDDVRLRQVIYNLVGNAIKFSSGRPEKRGRVSIRVEVVEASPLRLGFRIADDGIGMAPETLKELFTPFTQAEVSTTRLFGGTGLGLAICKRLVDLMQGEIDVESTLGLGSIFTVTLPVEIASGGTGRSFPDLTNLACIVVAGPDFNRDDLRVYLEYAGASVYLADDLADAAQRASDPVLSVVVHDAGRDALSIDALYAVFAAAPNARHLLITRGWRLRAGGEASNVVTLDGDALRRQALLRAVAVVAGRASPEMFHDDTRKETAAEEQVPPTIAEARAQGQLILVAEDDSINQKVILKQLGLLGYAAEVAGNGTEALRLWRDGDYALLLTDLHMPEMDGYTLAESIRREEVGRGRMPILALTANALRGEASRAKAAGIDEYLTKPVQLRLLKAALEKWLPKATPSIPPAAAPEEIRTERGQSVVDVEVLKGLVGDDEVTVREFLGDYLASARRLTTELRDACAVADARKVGAIAHKLKSSSRSVGALGLGDVCAELENAGKAEDRAAIAQGVAQFDAAMAAVEACIVDLLAEQ